MAAIDYAEIQAVAKELIEDAGRSVQFVKLDRTTKDDAAKPWRGTANPRATPAAALTAKAAFIDPVSARHWGLALDVQDGMRRADQVCVVAHTSVGQSLEDFDEIWDNDGSAWGIIGIMELKPADLPILYGVSVYQ